MKATFGAISAFLIASALAGSAMAADPVPAAETSTGAAASSQPSATSANQKHKHHAGTHHDKVKKPDSNG